MQRLSSSTSDSSDIDETNGDEFGQVDLDLFEEVPDDMTWKEIAVGIPGLAGDATRRFSTVATTKADKVADTLVKQPIKKGHQKLMPHWRGVVTGSKEKRIRDYIKEERGALRLDQLAFTTGVLAMLITEYIILQWPGYFWLWYMILTPILFTIRFWTYMKANHGYFLLDFCYYAQIFCVLSIFFPNNTFLYRINFAFATGPLAWACVLWRNSLVFHSMDKITSVFLHFVPGLLMMDWRWSCSTIPIEEQGNKWIRKMSCVAVDAPVDSYVMSYIVYPILAYLLWQVLYFVKTEIIDRELLDSDPSLQTSLRWLSRDTRNGMHQFVRKILVKLGLFRKDEQFDPTSVKTKIIFIVTQLLYTIITMIPLLIIIRSRTLHILCFLFILCKLVQNGAAYYIQIFSKRYRQQVEKTQAEYLAKIKTNETVSTNAQQIITNQNNDDNKNKNNNKNINVKKQQKGN